MPGDEGRGEKWMREIEKLREEERGKKGRVGERGRKGGGEKETNERERETDTSKKKLTRITDVRKRKERL